MPSEEYKGRRTEVYLPDENFLKKWKEKAKASTMPLSRWIFETVEAAIDDQKPFQFADFAQEKESLQSENRRLRRELEATEKQMEAYRTEAFTLRNQLFLQLRPVGQGQIDEKLLEILQQGGTWHTQDLLREMDISPKDVDALRVVARQLQLLQDHGLVSEGVRGWRWLG